MKSKTEINTLNATYSLFNALGLRYTKFNLKNTLVNNYNFPSLASISDTLNEYNISNTSIKVEFSKLKDIPTPFIANLNIKDEEFVLVSKIENENVYYISNKRKIINTEAFKVKWTGIILYAEKSEKSNEQNLKQNIRLQFLKLLKIPFAICLACCVFVFALSTQAFYFQLPYFLYLFSKVLGTVISILLLIQMVDLSNPFVKKLCSTIKKGNCNNILESNAAKIFGVISWSEIGFIYFTGSLLIALFTPSLISLLNILSFLAIPYTIFSIYYQWKVVREWCLLCLLIQIIFWVEAIVSLFLISKNSLSLLTLIDLAKFILLFSLTIALWAFIKPFIESFFENQKLKVQLNKFKSDTALFNAMLKLNEPIHIEDDFPTIVYGNPKAEFEITIVTNPLCKPCAEAHKKIEKILELNVDEIKVQTIFAAGQKEEEERYMIAEKLISIYKNDSKSKAQDATNFWYNLKAKNNPSFDIEYPTKLKGNEQIILEQHFKWCKNNMIVFTPSIFVNKYPLPDCYTIEDLKYFIKQT